MSDITLTVHVPSELSHELAQLSSAAKRTVTEGAAMGIEAALRDHFLDLQRRPRKDGFQPVGFWSGTDGNSVAEQISEHLVSSDGFATVTVDDHRLRFKIDGGTIKASDYGHPYLTLPATNEAAHAPEGARSFQTHIAWVPHPDGGVRPALLAGPKQPGTKPSTADALFWLVRKVTQQPMPDAIPSDQTLGDAARDAALDAIDALLAQGDAA